MSQTLLLASVLGLGALFTPSLPAEQPQPQTSQQAPARVDQNAPAKQKSAAFHSEGERIFAQNCSRCHAAPEGFSPSISGTVVRHMRVRASLSQHDEQELLRFFNP
jgi:cytochrome c5